MAGLLRMASSSLMTTLTMFIDLHDFYNTSIGFPSISLQVPSIPKLLPRSYKPKSWFRFYTLGSVSRSCSIFSASSCCQNIATNCTIFFYDPNHLKESPMVAEHLHIFVLPQDCRFELVEFLNKFTTPFFIFSTSLHYSP